MNIRKCFIFLHCYVRTKGQVIQIYFRLGVYLWFYCCCWDFFKKILCIDVLLVCLCTMCTVPREARRGHQTLKLESQMVVSNHMVLGIEPGSSGRAINVLNPWPISLALVSFCTMVLALPQSGYHESCSSCIYSLSPNSKGIPFSWDGMCSLMKVPFFIIWEVHAVCSDNTCLPPLPQLFHSHSMYSLLSPVCTAQIGVRLSTSWPTRDYWKLTIPQNPSTANSSPVWGGRDSWAHPCLMLINWTLSMSKAVSWFALSTAWLF